jgi:hypothetical protein
MSAQGGRRPITSSDFNRLLFALVLLAALAIMARLVTRQDTHAEMNEEGTVTVAEWLRTADALFVRGEWAMAADAYFGALEQAAQGDRSVDVRVYAKLAESLYSRGERRAGLHFMRLYRSSLERYRQNRAPASLDPTDPFLLPENLDSELLKADARLTLWSQAN